MGVRTLGISGFFLIVCFSVACTTSLEQNGGNVSTSKKIVVFGASGKIGGLIVTEALDRGHRVVGISRRPEALLVNHESFFAVKGDVTNIDSFHEVTNGADAVVIAVHGTGVDNTPENSVHSRAASVAVTALDGVKGGPYVLQIGGATTMFETAEAMVEELPFPAEQGSRAHAMFFGHLVALQTYRASSIDWTVLTPPFRIKGWTPDGIVNSTRTGRYRTSTEIIVNADGERAPILVADLAVAAIDEIEKRRFVRRRFTVAN